MIYSIWAKDGVVLHFHIVTKNYSQDGNPSASGKEDSELEQDDSPSAPGQKKIRKLGMASILRVVVDISSSKQQKIGSTGFYWWVGTWMLRSLSVIICLCYRYS